MDSRSKRICLLDGARSSGVDITSEQSTGVWWIEGVSMLIIEERR